MTRRYVLRTCHYCGSLKSQPEMHREVIYENVGRSRPGVSIRTGIGFLAGDRHSKNSIIRWIFNSGQRNHQRKRVVWLCGSDDCVKPKKFSIFKWLLTFF